MSRTLLLESGGVLVSGLSIMVVICAERLLLLLLLLGVGRGDFGRLM